MKANEAVWTGLTTGQLRELARAFVTATVKAERLEDLPSDAWLDVRLRDHGRPEANLAEWRARIKALRLAPLAPGTPER